MLGKLLKYEMRDTSKYFIPMFAGFLFTTVFCKIFTEINRSLVTNNKIVSLIGGILIVTYVIYIIGMFVMTLVFLVTHFCRTMAGDQGYLVHTLPVKTSSIINSKLIAAVIWQILAVIMLILSFCILFIGYVNMNDLSQLFQEMGPVIQKLSYYVSLPLLITEFFICAITALLINPLQFYACYSVGHLFEKHRVLWSVVCYFVLYFVTQFVSTIVLSIGSISNMSHYDGLEALNLMTFYMTYAVILSVATAIIYYAAVNYIFSRRLNLQ